MVFSYSKAMLIRPSKEKWFSTFFLALLLASAVFVPYVIMNGNYFKHLAEIGIKQLPIFFISPNKLGSGNHNSLIVDSYGMVLARPAVWLDWLMHKDILPFICAGLMVLRLAFSALTAYFYIRRFTRTPAAARAGAFLYAFSSAVMGAAVNNQLQNAVALFPLLLLAAEKLLTENRRIGLCAAVFCAAVINGYSFFSALVFLVLYLVLRMASKDVKVNFARVFWVIFEILLGILSAAVIFVPITFICVLNTFEPVDFMGFKALFHEGGQIYLGLIKSFLMPADSMINSTMFNEFTASKGIFGAYLPLISLSGVIAFCGANKNSSFKRIIIAGVICLVVPAITGIFSIANPAAGYMWFYMPTLIFATVSVMAFENREISLNAGIKWSVGLTILAGVLISVFPNIGENGLVLGLYNGAMNLATLIRILIYFAVAIIGLIAFAVILKVAKLRKEAFFNAVAAAVAIISAITLWLCTATDIAFYGNSLLSPYMSTNLDNLNPSAISVNGLIYYSALVSVAAMCVFIVYIIVCAATHKKRRAMHYIYPEGEALLELWQHLDEEDANERLLDDREFSLDNIADSLQMEYPVNSNIDEFQGGFSMVLDINKDNINGSIDK